MADVTNIQPLPQEPGKPDQKTVPSDKFKEQMRKVGESPEKQKKQRERKEEKEQKAGAALRTGASTSEKQVEGVKKLPKYPKVEKVGESEKKQPKQQKLPDEAELEEIAGGPVSPQEKIEAIDLTQIETTQLEKKKTPSYVAPPGPEEEIEKPTQAEEEKIAFPKTAPKEAPQKKEAQPPLAPATTALGPLFLPPAPQTAPAYTLLPGDALVLYEKMVSQILIMRTSGVSETIFHIDAPGSVFTGSQIIIREYSTAPLSFNIELVGSPQNALAFDQNIGSLRAAFASEKRNFTVHDIKSSIRSERPPHRRVKRKEEEGL